MGYRELLIFILNKKTNQKYCKWKKKYTYIFLLFICKREKFFLIGSDGPPYIYPWIMNNIFVNIFVCFFLIMLHFFGKFFSHFYMTIIMICRHILLWFKFLFFVLYKQRQFIDNLYSNSHHYALILFALVIETIFQMHDSANFCLCNHQQNYSIRTLWIVFQ